MFLPQYNPYNNQYPPQTDADIAAAVTIATMLWGLMILLGLFLLCAWCTKLVLQHIVNPYLKGALDREDGLVVVWSTLIWAAIGLVLMIPSVVGEPSLALSLVSAGLTGGALWGAAIGAFLVVALWLEVDEQPWEPTHGFEAITNLPGELYQSTELETASDVEEKLDEINAMLREDADLENPEPARSVESVPTITKNRPQAEAVGV